MRNLAFILLITTTAFSQNLTEFGAVSADSVVGGASGKATSNGISAMLGNVDQQTAKAAKPQKAQPKTAAFKVARSAPSADTGGVPLPPPETHKRAGVRPLPVAQIGVPQGVTRSLAEVAVLPPPPQMSPVEFRTLSNGMARADVLKLGEPASRITMDEDGRLVEIYSYHQNGQKFGALRLTDGVVSKVE